MSLTSISKAAQSPSLRERIAASIAEQIAAGSYTPPVGGAGHPLNLASSIQWMCAAEPGWGDAWASAEAAGNPDPGVDVAVVPDAWILTAVQKHLSIGVDAEVLPE